MRKIPTSSSKLVSAAQSGCEDSLNRFCAKYWLVVENWARKYHTHNATSEDIAQNVLIRVLPNLHKYDRNKGKFRSWLAKITKHSAIDLSNDSSFGVNSFFGDVDQLFNSVENQEAFEAKPDSDLIDLQEGSYTIEDCIREKFEFDDDTWFCFSGIMELGLKAHEIGDSFNPPISADAVRQRKARVVIKLRRVLEDKSDPQSHGSE